MPNSLPERPQPQRKMNQVMIPDGKFSLEPWKGGQISTDKKLFDSLDFVNSTANNSPNNVSIAKIA